MLHFSDDTGRRILATFTMEGDHIEAFAGSDIQLASTLRFTELPAREKQVTEAGGATQKRVAELKSSGNLNQEVQSASDLK